MSVLVLTWWWSHPTQVKASDGTVKPRLVLKWGMKWQHEEMCASSQPSSRNVLNVLPHWSFQHERITWCVLHHSSGQITTVWEPPLTLIVYSSLLPCIVTRTGSYLPTQAGIQLFNRPLPPHASLVYYWGRNGFIPNWGVNETLLGDKWELKRI